jgi:hypothetical protein
VGSIAVCLAGLLLGIIGVLLVRRHGPRAWWLLNNPVGRIAELKPGPAAIEGRIVADDVIEAPLAHEPCVLVVQERWNKDDPNQADYVVEDFRNAAWGVEDGSGAVEVELLANATAQPEKCLAAVRPFLRLSFEGSAVRERLLEEGTAVYVQGEVVLRDGEPCFAGEVLLAASRAAIEQRSVSRAMLGMLSILLGFTMAGVAMFLS